jgi:hypothetical protein
MRVGIGSLSPDRLVRLHPARLVAGTDPPHIPLCLEAVVLDIRPSHQSVRSPTRLKTDIGATLLYRFPMPWGLQSSCVLALVVKLNEGELNNKTQACQARLNIAYRTCRTLIYTYPRQAVVTPLL